MTDFKQYLLDEFVEDYQEGLLTRRDALKLIAGITGSMALATSLLAACAPPDQPAPATAATTVATTAPRATSTPNAAAAPTTAPQATATLAATSTAAAIPTTAANGEIEASDIEFDGSDGAKLLAHLARPDSGAAAPVVLVCHENRGLTEHIKDVTRRFAREGYVALAVDLLSRQGGTAGKDSSSVPGLLSSQPQDQFVADFTSGWRYLQSQSYVQADRVGMTGFCFGGGVTWRVAIGLPELRAAVPFYGPAPAADEVASINAAVLAMYAERDTRITSTAATMEAAMVQNGKTFEKIVYSNSDHAFFNDTGTRYN
ncbi:MAG: dienelactone hydrolase family protein, partial [Chloroflexi bacterium]|nr:dienelactone hydrolase family protein [Chloroflexota bacterium]